MNIQNLLKKIQQRRDQRKENINTISSQRLVKPIYDQTDANHVSIGTVNEMPNTQNDRSYFKQYFESFATEESKEQISASQIHTNTNKGNKLQRIESELDDIQKMKSLFQNKKKLQTNGSIERQCNRSIEKHTLKPSLVPKFKPTSEFIVNHEYNKDQSVSYTFKDQSFNNNNKTQVISFKGAHIFDDSQQVSRRTIQLPNQQIWGQNKYDTEKPQKCICEETLKDFMADVAHKMSLLSLKISQLEESNSSIKTKHQKVINSNLKAMQILKRLQQQKEQLIETQQKWTNSKDELQSMLKQVNTKRQKTCPKENMNKQDCQNYFKNKDKSKSPLKPNNHSDQKKVGKNKVESLLQRLQLRVQK